MGFEFVRVGHVIERHLRTVNATKDISLLIGGREKRMSAEVRFNTGVDLEQPFAVPNHQENGLVFGIKLPVRPAVLIINIAPGRGHTDHAAL